jgi:hypothetical protein
MKRRYFLFIFFLPVIVTAKGRCRQDATADHGRGLVTATGSFHAPMREPIADPPNSMRPETGDEKAQQENRHQKKQAKAS